MLSLGQLCLTHSPLQSQPSSIPKGTSTVAHRLGYMGFKKFQFLMRTGVLANTEATKSLRNSACKLTTYPLCAACQLNPGQRIAVDHYIRSTKGRLFTSRGYTKDTDMYAGGALFMDMSSNEWKMCFNNISTLMKLSRPIKTLS